MAIRIEKKLCRLLPKVGWHAARFPGWLVAENHGCKTWVINTSRAG
jgi:hypothetical protein